MTAEETLMLMAGLRLPMGLDAIIGQERIIIM